MSFPVVSGQANACVTRKMAQMTIEACHGEERIKVSGIKVMQEAWGCWVLA